MSNYKTTDEEEEFAPLPIDEEEENGQEEVVKRGAQVTQKVNVAKVKPPGTRFEEKYSRTTVYIANDILDVMNQEIGNTRGKKTEIVNKALAKHLGIKYNG